MIHARNDYDHIQDPKGKIPEDEPVFLLRGQDVAAPAAVNEWADAAAAHGADPQMVAAARAQAKRMILWQQEMTAKVPDVPGKVAQWPEPSQK